MEDDIDATRKRKVDGSLAATRLGQTTTQRWANERFRQTMLLVLEFRMEWPTQSLLTSDDVEGIHTAIDNALVFATNSSHVGDIYDTNPTCWAIWLVQRAHTLKGSLSSAQLGIYVAGVLGNATVVARDLRKDPKGPTDYRPSYS